MLYPMKMSPAFKDYLWGGDTLKTRYGKATPLSIVAESWEVSCYPDSPSVVSNGAFAGKPLLEVVGENPSAMGKSFGEFPVLIKLIDAEQALSLQVHPGDEYARRHENQAGKNEMWYVIDAKEGAELIIGFKEPLSNEELRDAIENGTILDKANRVPVKAGDCFSIPAGLLHAIGAGILIAEVQQSSNVTYRVYDYNRTGADGKPRELHIKQALDVIDTAKTPQNTAASKELMKDGYSVKELTDWDFFKTELVKTTGCASFFRDDTAFDCLLAIKGGVRVESGGGVITLKAGESAFIPAGLGGYRLAGIAEILKTTV